MSESELMRLYAEISDMRHNQLSRDIEMDDAFTRWTKRIDPAYWGKHDLSDCALGWNAAIDAAMTLVVKAAIKIRDVP